MIFRKSVVEHLGKVFLNLGQEIMMGAIVSGFLNEKAHSLGPMIALFFGAYTVFIGLKLISEIVNLEELAMTMFLILSGTIAIIGSVMVLVVRSHIKKRASQH